MSTPDVRVYADTLAAYLVGAGVLDTRHPDGGRWLEGLHAVPRHVFVPARAWAQPQSSDAVDHLIDRGAEPGPWWDAVYGNTAIITQRDAGNADVADLGGTPTSSLSCPYVAFEFLTLLDPADHHKVLEIGTGTGWTAAMLAWWLGDEQVVTVEIDKALAAQAAANLEAAGRTPLVVAGDGVDGYADGAPYDRVHVTCGVRTVPYPWVAQTRPGGVIALPYMPIDNQWGYKLRLDVLDDGTAIGRFGGGCGFMMLRSQQRRPWPSYTDDGVTSTSRFDPRTAVGSLSYGLALYLSAVAPHLTITTAGPEDIQGEAAWVMRLRERVGDGWAIAHAYPGQTDTEITQGGARRLWDEFQAAFMAWLRAGRPGRDRFGMTVSGDRQEIWLDTP